MSLYQHNSLPHVNQNPIAIQMIPSQQLKLLRKFCRKKNHFAPKTQTYHINSHWMCEVFDFTLIWIIARTHTREAFLWYIWILWFSLNYNFDSRDLCESIKCSFVIRKTAYVMRFTERDCVRMHYKYSFSFHANETSTRSSLRPFEALCFVTEKKSVKS